MKTVCPLEDRVVVKIGSNESLVEFGIVIPETAKPEYPAEGTVVAVGPNVGNQEKIFVGQSVLFAKFAGDDYEQGGEKYKILKEESVLACLEDK